MSTSPARSTSRSHPCAASISAKREFERCSTSSRAVSRPVRTDRSGFRTSAYGEFDGSSRPTAISPRCSAATPGRRGLARGRLADRLVEPAAADAAVCRSNCTTESSELQGRRLPAVEPVQVGGELFRSAHAQDGLRAKATGPAACQVKRLSAPRRATRSMRLRRSFSQAARAAATLSGPRRARGRQASPHPRSPSPRLAPQRASSHARRRRSARCLPARSRARRGRAVWIGQAVHAPASSASFDSAGAVRRIACLRTLKSHLAGPGLAHCVAVGEGDEIERGACRGPGRRSDGSPDAGTP